MAILIIVFTFLLASISLFNISMNMNIVNREIINTPKEIFERSIPLAQEKEKEDITLYFDKVLLENELTSYYNISISNYVRYYTMDILYYESKDGSFCLSDYCSCVEISINCYFLFNFSLKRTLNFSILEMLNGQE